MVHRPSDSRLLANLLSHEKDYSKHLSVLLDYSQSSLASFSAYAATCAPPMSQVIIAVAGNLAGADDALRNYAAAVERWQEQLKALKQMEDDVGNIMRDREILVTRLIKASKQQKPTRDSVLGGSPSGSVLSITKPEVQVGQKLSAAQSELQACEAHLASKEQELNVFRTHTIKSGLQARCRVMTECGWAWGEMGKEGIRALDTLGMENGYGSPFSYPYLHKPLPNHDQAGSDISSLAPSQSASQIGHSSGQGTLVEPSWRASSPLTVPTLPKPYTLQIPPAHSIGEYAMPNGTVQHSTIEEEPGGSSAEEEETEIPTEVHENPRFSKGKPKAKAPSISASVPSRHISFSLRGPKASTSESMLGEASSLRSDSPTKKTKKRSGSMLGNLAALFHVGGSRNDVDDVTRTSPSKAPGRWQTRIDRNLASVKRGDSSDEEGPTPSHSYGTRATSPTPILLNSPAKGSPVEGNTQRLKKRALKRGSVQAPSSARTVDADKGYASDTVAESLSKARGRRGRDKTRSKSPSETGVNGPARPSTPKQNDWAGPGGSGTTRLKKPPNGALALLSEGGPSLSRNSSISKQSISSSASAPPRTGSMLHISTPSPLGRQGSTSRKRTASLNVTPASNGTPPSPTKHKRTVSTSATSATTRLPNGEPSLMSIVEGMSRINKDAALKQDPNRLLVVPKAPGPVNITIDEVRAEVNAMARQHSEGSATPRPRLKKEKEGGAEAHNYRNSLLMSASLSAPSLPIATASQPKPLPTKMPLRSALRNASRTPSPNPNSPPLPPLSLSLPQTQSPPPPQPQRPAAAPANGNVPMSTPTRPSDTLTVLRPDLMSKRRASDVSSISSYETGHEVFDDEPEPSPPPSPSLPPPPPPPHDNVSDVSNSTTSTASPPVRRKSVRMSLPPTFSATPPALDETDEDERERHEPWSHSSRARGGSATPRAEGGPGGAWGSRIEQNGARDVWADSSDEDTEYSAAKRLLTRLARKQES